MPRLVDTVWSFILTLVRSLLALFSFRRRASDLPTVIRTPADALARAHSRLRPIHLTPRSLALAPARAQSTRTSSATSTLFPGPSVPTGGPQRTSPKLDSLDAELGLPCDLPATSATSSRDGTLDTSHTGSYVPPLTPPDRCYLAPLPSVTDCPYSEPWPTNIPLDRGKPRLPASPLKLSTNIDSAFPEPMLGPIGSPPPGRWNPVEIWTSTPCKNDSPVPDLALSFDYPKDPSSAMGNISHALVSRSQSSIQPYNDTSISSLSSDASPFADYSNGGTRPRAHAHVPRSSKLQPYPRFHHPDAYVYAWRRHGARLPGKHNRPHAYGRSQSYMDLAAREWYDADAYASSPIPALSPPLGESATEDDDDEEMPLGRLRERLARRSAAVGLGLPKSAAISPRTRRMSEGCLLAISESPTRIGVGVRPGRHVRSMAYDGDGYTAKDWLEALSLRFSSEDKDALESEMEPCMAVPAVDVAAC
ncbi:hypothetical protein OG21DRAFT_1484700 [Imleria badia]|nr:hypothetical protein OG21DRAFT_1484700 [Imleria badia]